MASQYPARLDRRSGSNSASISGALAFHILLAWSIGWAVQPSMGRRARWIAFLVTISFLALSTAV